MKRIYTVLIVIFFLASGTISLVNADMLTYFDASVNIVSKQSFDRVASPFNLTFRALWATRPE